MKYVFSCVSCERGGGISYFSLWCTTVSLRVRVSLPVGVRSLKQRKFIKRGGTERHRGDQQDDQVQTATDFSMLQEERCCADHPTI